MGIRRALISVSDRRGIVDLGRALSNHGVEILATGGTAEALRGAGCPVVPVSEYTGSPEILGGRVKTLHPRIHAGILARAGEQDLSELARLGIGAIDLVVVNLYPFVETVAKPDVTMADAFDQVDIGGPTLIRAAAKSWQRVVVVVDPSDYFDIMLALDRSEGGPGAERRFALARKAFAHTAAYDAAIANWLGARSLDGEAEAFPETLTLQFHRHLAMRYGENPHQQAALYREEPAVATSVAGGRQLQGKELSYNNVLDLDAALSLAIDLAAPAAVVVKHGNPCGVALADNPAEALRLARAADPMSAFGGIVAFNRPVTRAVAEELRESFLEAVVAPAFDDEARDLLAPKSKLRLLEVACLERREPGLELRGVAGGLLVQTGDRGSSVRGSVATKRAPSDREWEALEFAWSVVRHVRSNAIVLAHQDRTVGIGAGQMSRLDSVRLAISKALSPTAGTAMASDAFFPFRDGLDTAAAAGVTAVAQPGGSVRDAEVIAAADAAGIAMVMTGFRHFSH